MAYKLEFRWKDATQCLEASLQPFIHTHTHIISHTQHMRLWTCVVLPFLPLPGLTAARNHIYKQAIKSRLGRQREATSWALGLAAQIPDRSGLSPALSCFLQRTEVHARWAYSPPPLRRRRRCAVAAAAPPPPLPPFLSLSPLPPPLPPRAAWPSRRRAPPQRVPCTLCLYACFSSQRALSLRSTCSQCTLR